jgi:EAL domain
MISRSFRGCRFTFSTPVITARGGGARSYERKRLRLSLLQLLEKRFRFGLDKTGSDLAGKAQFVPLEIAYQQRTEYSRVLRLFGVPTDHQLLFLDALGLEPGLAPPGAIRRIGSLGNDAFQGQMTGVRQDLFAGFSEVLALSERNEHIVIVQAVVSIARALGMTTAEGVETEAQHEFLVALGCDEVQGYLFSAPVPANGIGEFSAEWTRGDILAA